MIRLLPALAILTALGTPAAADPVASRVFSGVDTSTTGPAQPIGSYARGCAAGLQPLPETGPAWQAMRLSRGRMWGHPDTLDVIADLGRAAQALGWAGIYVGDISQPRGGPTPTGHASHQIGLDVDIWMLPARSLTLTRAERETISSISVRSSDQTHVTAAFGPAHAALLRHAARDNRVDRIFVTPPVKVELCKTAQPADTPWLQKIRPYYGHDTHFHIRLKCPERASGCTPQRPTVAELSKGANGCDATLQWWVTDYLTPPAPDPNAPKPAPARHPRDYRLSELPAQCTVIATAPAP
jgi:penicillin-insensitive murein endopeptidase